MNIVISRTDNLGDVMLTLPLAVFIKKMQPEAKVFFIGKAYTAPLIRACAAVDMFLDREELLEKPQLLQEIAATVLVFVFPDRELAAKVWRFVPLRVGTSHRWFHWLYCNQLLNLSRKNAALHELDLNLKLLQPLFGQVPSLTADEKDFVAPTDFYQLKVEEGKYDYLKNLLLPNKFHLLMHPKSKGSAREWAIENYKTIAEELAAHATQVFITGTASEGEWLRASCPRLFELPHVVDLTGKLTLAELVAFISFADGLLACSTGPLHIAAAFGIHTLGLYPPLRPIHPQRWKPIGLRAGYLVAKEVCKACPDAKNCVCMQQLTTEAVKQKILSWLGQEVL
jgi:heptosyltransferase III